jgi:alkanesulfonate monooxygenase SsuD/methylene tetrahydromethanopterin reductase-like flavin-dependent oxidoreductase (luciferase family)
MIRMAEFADQRGSTRYWVAEHHSIPGVSTFSPAVLLARLTGHTQRIRLGAGGVMLRHHAPLVIADAYNMPTTQTGDHSPARTIS